MPSFHPEIQPEYPRRYHLCNNCQLLVSDLDFEAILGSKASSGYYESVDTENLENKFKRVMAMDVHQSDNWVRVKRVLNYIAEFQQSFGLVRGHNSLDIGSGTGVFAARLMLEDPAWSVDCVEPDPRACEHIKLSTSASVFCGILEDCKDLRKYDLISLNRVLEHLPSPLQTMQHIKSLLSPGGIVYVEVPDLICYDLFGAKAPEFGVEHLTIWSPVALLKLLKRCGLTGLCSLRTKEPSGKISSTVFAANIQDIEVKRA